MADDPASALPRAEAITGTPEVVTSTVVKAAAPKRKRARERAGPTDISDPLLREEAKRAFVWIGIASAFALVVLLAQPLLVVFAAMVFAAMVDGGARLLDRVLPIARGWRVAIVLILVAAFLIWTAYFAGSQIAAQAAALPATVEAQGLKVIDWLRAHGFAIQATDFKDLIREGLGGVGQLTRVVGGVIGTVGTVVMVIVLGIYFAVEPRLYRRGVAWLFPSDRRDYFEGTAQLMGSSLRRLMAGRLLGMTLEGICTWLLLMAYGVPMAALLGLLTGLLAFLPNIGAPLSGLLMILVGFSGGFDMGIYCIIVYVVVQTVDGNIIVPMVARRTVDLAPALVLGMQLIMGVLFGIIGLILADPMVAMIKIWLEREAARHEAERVG
ncbi:AI-2E family transporter [Novosphingobium sp. G106]|uniref:AI-2E family transporter n=1 Tax=Novosphingobium sp. G106 TaxID=2849500 RepID=UPI001C2D82ED|nr:AI-2E family transporter [Novosphingobium sp. G106]MBV1691142.1 AI-2E family transporter [Novosphingobium sp. G106]